MTDEVADAVAVATFEVVAAEWVEAAEALDTAAEVAAAAVVAAAVVEATAAEVAKAALVTPGTNNCTSRSRGSSRVHENGGKQGGRRVSGEHNGLLAFGLHGVVPRKFQESPSCFRSKRHVKL